jgi:hypothetical protein
VRALCAVAQSQCGAEQKLHSRRSGKLTEGSISNTPHIVTVSIPRCERGGAGASAQPRSGNFQREAPLCAGEANPVAEYISDAFHGVIAALLFVEETESGRNRLRSPIYDLSGRGRPHSGTIFIIVRKAKSRASGLQHRITQCKPGAHVHFSSDTREPANSLGLGPRRARGSTGVSDHFYWSVA